MSRILKEQELRNQLLTGLISESTFQEELDKVIKEDEMSRLEDAAEDNLEKALKIVINQLPNQMKKFAKEEGDKDNVLDINEEYVEDPQVGGKGRAFNMFMREGGYGEADQDIAEAIKDWAGNYMLGFNEPDYKGVSDVMTPSIFKIVKMSAPNTFIKEMKDHIMNEFKAPGNGGVGQGVGIKDVPGYELQVKEQGLEEVIGSLAASVALTAPALINTAGKATKWIGKKVNSNLIKKLGHKFEDFGHEWLATYQKVIANMIKKLAPNATDEQAKKIAKGILLSISGAMIVATGIGASDLIAQGQTATAGVETSKMLHSIGRMNPALVAKTVAKILPNVLAQFFELAPKGV